MVRPIGGRIGGMVDVMSGGGCAVVCCVASFTLIGLVDI